MQVKDEIFRMYDIRGIVETDLTDDLVFALGRAYGTLIRRNRGVEVSVGYDARLSSPHLHDVLITGITSTGINVMDIGMVPTPLLYFSVFHYNLDGGIMITGSHNPKEYNGFKIMIEKETLFGDGIQKLKAMIINSDFLEGKGELRKKDVSMDYLEKVLSITYPGRKLRVILVPGNGTAGPIAVKCFERIGADVECINCEPDGNFPAHLPGPTIPEYMEQLKQVVPPHSMT